ncbi:tRNA-dihydrouridine synthase family protein [uncultured Bacteroides sp.]|uniref:tRNA-dihydrouridine synthase family protein n=1 Tax=uncultured Bacteroides sp. TaxID=162156 RepID=UPI0025CDD69D|nr:tRNA-dihydrouridine synthase family protein [uncultured Bacteroides sp.]
MNENLLPIQFAPLQGYTDAIYRRAHARAFGGIETYYSPFVRIEHGEIRRKDIRDVDPENNQDLHLIPQLIASESDKLEQIMALFIEKGYEKADINLGCPFPVLAKRHNGAGILPYPEEVKVLLMNAIEKYPDIKFSIKLRLGWDNPEECLALLPLFNELPLTHIILHPRLGKQQYKGEVDLNAFEAFYKGCNKPLLYNGDLLTLKDIQSVSARFPKLAGLVIGRGLLANPALALEYQQGKALSSDEMAKKVGQLHTEVYGGYQELLQGGETQLLMKMKSFWEYLLPEGDRKSKKTIHKTSKLTNYQAAVSNLLGTYHK